MQFGYELNLSLGYTLIYYKGPFALFFEGLIIITDKLQMNWIASENFFDVLNSCAYQNNKFMAFESVFGLGVDELDLISLRTSRYSCSLNNFFY